MLKINNLSKSYGEVSALNGVGFNVNQGEIFGLIGPDGSGKTSLFRIVATLLLADEGVVEMNGKNVVEDIDYVRNNVGYMPGRFSLYHDLTVRENLSFFATIFETTIEENRYLIEDIYHQIEPFEDRRAGDLSGGMKQKLALCCALIHKPKLLLLDEPTTGVDAVSRKEFWEMLKSLKKEGISILVSTPYMDESKQCDRVAFIQDGSLLDIDTPEGIVSKFDKIVYRITGSNLYTLLNELRKMEEVDQAYPFGDCLHVYAMENIQVKSLLEEKFQDHHIKVEKSVPDIEDCFMNLMTKTEF